MQNLDLVTEISASPIHHEKSSTSTYTVISTVAFLIGVPEHIFENEHEAPDIAVYQKLKFNRNACIIRDLCMVRTAIIRNFKRVNQEVFHNYRLLSSLKEYIPVQCIHELGNWGINLLKKNTRLAQYIVDINKYISDRINNCKNLFPLWLEWRYIKDIFIMPDGLTETGTKQASDNYYASFDCYPYQTYINWVFFQNDGNILYNDKKFVTLLYRWHEDDFSDLNKVSNVDNTVKNNIYDFLSESRDTVIVVDCENSDPYDLCATLNDLEDYLRDKISKIMLFDDVHTSSAWKVLQEHTDIPIERIEVARLKEDKSLVDTHLTANVVREFYANHVDSFVIVASDSDYWSVISTLKEARFLVMVEHEKCSGKLKEALDDNGIFYCYIDDFYSGSGKDIKLTAMLTEMKRYLAAHIDLNVTDMMDHLYTSTRAVMSDTEKHQFYQKYVKSLSLVIGDDGTASIQIKGK